MPRRSELLSYEKGLITAYSEAGYGVRKIATKIDCSHNVVGNYLRHRDTYRNYQNVFSEE